MIKAEKLTKQFGSFCAVRDLSFEIKPGEIFAFLGPNGAGKTTTIRLFTGLLKPTSGKAYICGIDTEKDPLAAKRQIGFLPDQPFVYPKLKGIEYLEFLADMYGISLRDYGKEISRLSQAFDMDEHLHELVETYSHGMRQKLVLTGIFFHRPKVIFFDEPMVGLDPKSAKVLKKLIAEYAAEGSTFFISTHTLEIAEKLCTRIGIIKSGELILLEDTQTLLSTKRHDASLEHIFLELTGGLEVIELVKEL